MPRVKKSAANASATGQLVTAMVDVLVHTGADLQEAQRRLIWQYRRAAN